MNVSKPYGETAAEEVDPIKVIKSAQVARAKKIEQRTRMVVGTAVVGMIILMGLNSLITPRIFVKSLRDVSFLQRFSLVWLGLMFACIPILMMTRFRAKYPFLFLSKAQMPSLLMGVAGLGVLFYVAAGFFSHPYTGASLNHTTEGWYFAGGWFLILLGIVFRK